MDHKSSLTCYLQAWKNSFRLHTPISYHEYWALIPVVFLTYCLSIAIFGIWFPQIPRYYYYIYMVVFAIPWISASARRLRTAGHNPYWVLLSLATGIGVIVLLAVLGVLKTSAEMTPEQQP